MSARFPVGTQVVLVSEYQWLGEPSPTPGVTIGSAGTVVTLVGHMPDQIWVTWDRIPFDPGSSGVGVDASCVEVPLPDLSTPDALERWLTDV